MDEIKEELEKIQKVLREEFKPFFIILFGSYARNSQNKESDIDIAIFSEKADKKSLFKTKQNLEEMTCKDIDLVNLAEENMAEGFKYEILMNGIVIYCENSYRFEMYKLDEFREYLDFNESRQSIVNRLKEGGTIYGE